MDYRGPYRQGLQCSSFLGLLRFLGKGLQYTTQKGTTSEGLGRQICIGNSFNMPTFRGIEYARPGSHYSRYLWLGQAQLETGKQPTSAVLARTLHSTICFWGS